MFIERIGYNAPFNPEGDPVKRDALIRHLETALGRRPSYPEPEEPVHETLPSVPEHETKPIPPDIREMTREVAAKLFRDEFMMAAIFGDEEKFGPQPDEY